MANVLRLIADILVVTSIIGLWMILYPLFENERAGSPTDEVRRRKKPHLTGNYVTKRA